MKTTQDDLGYWAGWFVAFAIAGLALIYAVWHGPQMQAVACSENETNCFRDWVSALGGWAAVAAAVPTVLFLSQQINDANRHQRENLQIQLRRTRVMVSRADSSARSLRQTAKIIERLWEVASLEEFPLDLLQAYESHVRTLTEQLDDEIFTFFEDEIAVHAPETVRNLREAARNRCVHDRAGSMELSESDFRHMAQEILSLCLHVREWTNHCTRECERYLTDTKKMMDRNFTDATDDHAATAP